MLDDEDGVVPEAVDTLSLPPHAASTETKPAIHVILNEFMVFDYRQWDIHYHIFRTLRIHDDEPTKRLQSFAIFISYSYLIASYFAQPQKNLMHLVTHRKILGRTIQHQPYLNLKQDAACQTATSELARLKKAARPTSR
jgi:hypothetical protein